MKKDKENPFGREFIIPFSGLSLGVHHYDFEIKDGFFSHFEGSEIDNGNFRIDLELTKQSTMLILKFHISGTSHVLCDRCSDDLDMEVKGDQQVIVKLGDEDFGDNDEIVSVPVTESEYDVSRHIYEFIILSLPQRRVHPEVKGKSTCNKEMLKKLKEVAPKLEEKKKTDPRWDKLKDLKFKN
jgi:uncharacterized metal-binding protein YceD (DUF177 family)